MLLDFLFRGAKPLLSCLVNSKEVDDVDEGEMPIDEEREDIHESFEFVRVDGRKRLLTGEILINRERIECFVSEGDEFDNTAWLTVIDVSSDGSGMCVIVIEQLGATGTLVGHHSYFFWKGLSERGMSEIVEGFGKELFENTPGLYRSLQRAIRESGIVE